MFQLQSYPNYVDKTKLQYSYEWFIRNVLGLNFSVVSPTALGEMAEETFDLVIDCTGSPAALEQAIGKTKYGATVLVFGCAPMGKSMK